MEMKAVQPRPFFRSSLRLHPDAAVKLVIDARSFPFSPCEHLRSSRIYTRVLSLQEVSKYEDFTKLSCSDNSSQVYSFK